jgi:demethylmenaquinone methyltransferase/2-methoxy-6-polyprenyl-1,4-benzoquinol methylase
MTGTPPDTPGDDRPASGPEGAWFGFRPVAERDKASLVRAVFDSVADRYDLMNDLMSGGLHRLWKAALVGEIEPRPHGVLLDVAGGTGDIARRYLERAATRRVAGARAVLLDINERMLTVGRNRLLDRGIADCIQFVVGDAESLPVADAAVDTYTIAFGLRNVTRIDAALAEARRVLKPGGRFFCLEFSHMVVPGLDRLYDSYSFSVVPLLGRLIGRDRDAYQYLVESIRRFPPQETLAERLRDAGLERVRYRNLSGGIAAIHSGWRL